MKITCWTLAVLACGCLAAAELNTLTEQEKAAGWKLLWDGKTLDGWVGEKCGCKTPPKKGWKIENGVLTVLASGERDKKGRFKAFPKDKNPGGGGDLVTKGIYKDFEFVCDFRLTFAGNSGIKYYYDPKRFRGTCEEYQVMDKNHPDQKHGHRGDHRVAALYDLIPANGADEVIKPLGEWNTARIVAKGNHVEHWLNGKKVVEYERGSEQFRALVAKSKYAKEAKKGERWGETPAGHIKLQDHTDSTVSYRNIKIREFK